MSPRFRLAAALAAAVFLAVPSGASAARHADFTVMSRNLYLGADIITLATAKDAADEQTKVAALVHTVVANDFPARAKEIAKEIATTKPDVVGLQEVATFRRGPDGVHDGPGGETTVLYDYLALLRKELAARGQHYRVAARQTELDTVRASSDGYDLRFTLGNAVLVRTGADARVKRAKGLSATFKAPQLTVPLPGGAVTATRGYVGLDGFVAGKRFRFLAPHAEAYGEQLALGQLKELLRTAAKSRRVPTIIAGDLNSDPSVKSGSTQQNQNDPNAPPSSVGNSGYNAMIAAGFRETTKKVLTCCQDSTLDNPVSKLDEWIDHILVRPKLKVLSFQRTGYRLSDRVHGLWPSDHAGIVARLRLG